MIAAFIAASENALKVVKNTNAIHRFGHDIFRDVGPGTSIYHFVRLDELSSNFENFFDFVTCLTQNLEFFSILKNFVK